MTYGVRWKKKKKKRGAAAAAALQASITYVVSSFSLLKVADRHTK